MRVWLVAAVAVLLAGGAGSLPVRAASNSPTVIAGGGNIVPLVERFRDLAGDDLGDKGPQKKGRREINWDAVPDDKAAPAFLPGDYFRDVGVILKTPGQGLEVSARAGNPAGVPPRFGNIKENYPQTFATFTAERLFSPVGSNEADVSFVIPGTDKPATVRGFGAIYTDVNAPHIGLEFFDADDNSLGRATVPANKGGFSFVGALFPKPVVARVKITYGSVALGPDDSADADVTVTDDFIYDEPQPVKASGKAAGKGKGGGSSKKRWE